MGSTRNSRLGNFARTMQGYPLYVTIGGSLNISLGDNPAFFNRRTFRQSGAVRGHYYVCMASAVIRV